MDAQQMTEHLRHMGYHQEQFVLNLISSYSLSLRDNTECISCHQAVSVDGFLCPHHQETVSEYTAHVIASVKHRIPIIGFDVVFSDEAVYVARTIFI